MLSCALPSVTPWTVACQAPLSSQADSLLSEPQGKPRVALVEKKPLANAGDQGSIPVLGRCPGKGHGSPLQDSFLENPMDRGAWRATISMGSQRVRHDWSLLSCTLYLRSSYSGKHFPNALRRFPLFISLVELSHMPTSRPTIGRGN